MKLQVKGIATSSKRAEKACRLREIQQAWIVASDQRRSKRK